MLEPCDVLLFDSAVGYKVSAARGTHGGGDSDKGNAMQHFRGRFNIQTFIVARPVSRRHRLSSIIRPCRMHKPGDWPGTDLPFGPVVQLADRRTKRRLPKYRDAVQWRAQCRYSGLEHVELP
jgi:hypothetical protein